MYRYFTLVALTALLAACGEPGQLDLTGGPEAARGDGERAWDERDREADTRDEARHEDATCEEACGRRARHAYDDCLDTGRDAEACARYARSLHAECLATHCDDSARGERELDEREREGRDERDERDEVADNCVDACAERGAVTYRTCLADGGSEARCANLAREVQADCLAVHCD
ncbi:MAG: hypothetical protein EA397_04520 [Deltaproteobacteria bacterium]|nr:MAG: hypothetical protein EA397_04520 [Deltaproteobacteria bacterium]